MGRNLRLVFRCPMFAKPRTKGIGFAQCSGVFVKVVLTVIAEAPPREFSC